MKFAAMTERAIMKNMACITGKSLYAMESNSHFPSPFQLKIVSVMIAPLNMKPNDKATLVISGSEAFLKACLKSTALSPRPLARAVRRSEEHTSELQSRVDLVCRLL